MTSRGYSLVLVQLLIAVASLVAEYGLQGARASVSVACGLSSCSWQDTGSVIMAHGLSSPRDRTGVLCIARQILNHWTTSGNPLHPDLNEHLRSSFREGLGAPV